MLWDASSQNSNYLKVLPSERYYAKKRFCLPKNIQIESGDHLVIFLTEQQDVDEVEKLFQVGFEFL